MSDTLVYHTGALGDFLTALPSIDAWRRLHPGSRAVLLGRPAFAGLAAPVFDDVRDADGPAWARLFSPAFVPTPDIAARLGGVGSAFLFTAAGSPLPASLSALGVTEILRQDPFPSTAIPIVDYHLSLFPPSVTALVGRQPRVRAAPDAVVTAGCVALHPGSGSPSKNWAWERFVELGRWLQEWGRSVAWITGPAEQAATPEGMEEWHNIPLVDLAGRIRECAAFVGNDSGITHLAAATGCPTIALFGVTDPAVWAPRGDSIVVMAAPHGDLSEIKPSEVLQTCERILRD